MADSVVNNDVATVPQKDDKSGLLEKDFVFVCLAQLVGYMGNGFTGPVFPLFIISMGYTESFAGIAVAALNVVGFNCRPVYGYLVDSGKARGAQLIAGLLLGGACLLYLIPNIFVIFLARGIHGLGWGGLNVVGSAWTAFLAPRARRAEAMGYYTMMQRVGSALSPVAALWVATHYGFPPVFIAASVLCFMVTLATLRTSPDRQPPSIPAEGSGSWVRRAIEPGALVGAGLLALSIISGPAVNTFMPLYFLHLGLPNIELYFLILGITGVVSRGVIGRWSDRFGRIWSISLGFVTAIVGLCIIAFSTEVWGLALGGALYTIGGSLSEPSLYAIAIDRSPVNRRGAAMATYTMAFQLGGGIGAVAGGFLIEYAGYQWLHIATICVGFIALTTATLGSRRWHWNESPVH